MNIADMHVWFRTYAQQMGMQNVRAILPEQIDILLNTSISDAVNQLIRENIGITNDRVVTDNSKVGQINALRTLYKVKTITLCGDPNATVLSELPDYFPFALEAQDRNIGKLHYYGSTKEHYKMPEFLYLVDFSINYKAAIEGIGSVTQPHSATFSYESLATNYFPVRLIDDAYLADALNDFVLKNRLRSPIMVTYNGSYDLYIDKFTMNTNGQFKLDNDLVPYQLRVAYIAKPAVVKFAYDLGGTNVDCDLPDTMHVDIVKHAVGLYQAAIAGSIGAAQQQEKQQQQENARNNVRNEDY